MTTNAELHESIDSLTQTALRVKAERDALLAACQAYLQADSERSDRLAREQMRDAVEMATGVRP